MLQNTHSMKQPDLYYFEGHKSGFISLVKVHGEYSPGASTLHIKFDKDCDVIFMVSK